MAFFVIEGLDGAGKSTQLELLKDHFANIGKKTEYIHFPTTDSPIFGDLVSRFLRGDFGGIKDVNPYLVALLFAGDRYNLKNKINSWLEEGKIVINDRYVFSNIGFQCAKMNNEKEADELFDWIFNLEFEYFKIPKPDLSIFLDVPFSFTENKLKQTREGKDREYLQGKKDIHEEDLSFQKSVRKTYLRAIEKYPNLIIRIDCSDENGHILSPESISKLIIKEIEKRFTF
jgi:dTMP kinase